MFAGCAGICANERAIVRHGKSLDEAKSKVVVPETNDVVFEENNGKLVLVGDTLKIPDALDDFDYDISIHAVKMKRFVQMFQWFETADAVEEGLEEHEGHKATSYSYDTGWFDRRIDSEAFDNSLGHHNPELWPLNSSLVTNPRVKLGNFLLGKDLKTKFDDFTVFTSDVRPANPDIKMHAGLYFHAKDVWKPEVGDIRVQFSYAGRHGDPVTVVGRQSGREIRPYVTESGDELLILHPGLRKPEDVFDFERAQSRLNTWFVRFAGWFATFVGFNIGLGLLEAGLDAYPRSVETALALGYASLPFSLSLTSAMTSVGVGWVAYRPGFGVTLFAVASLPFVVAGIRCYRYRRRTH